MTGVASARRGEARGEENGEAVDDLVRPNGAGTYPGGASGLTPSLGDPDRGAPGFRHEAGEGRRNIDWRIGGGDAELPPLSL